MRIHVVKVVVATAFALVLLIGCTNRVCPPRCGPATQPDATGCPGAKQAIGRMLASRSDELGTPPIQILALSGGGLNGAFGAGFLLGWRDNANDPRPKFDIVTGVSTGALQAPWVFLDTPQADARMRHLYLTSGAEDLFCERPKTEWLTAPSLYDHSGLLRKMRMNYTNELIDRVAAESHRARAAGRPRLLLVASVNLDSGYTHCWDLTRMAERAPQNPKLYDRFRAAVLASAVHPVFLPPVMIDGSLHTDGGAREQVMVPEILQAVSQHLQVQAMRVFDAKSQAEKQEIQSNALKKLDAQPPPSDTNQPQDAPDDDSGLDDIPEFGAGLDEPDEFGAGRDLFRDDFVRDNHPRVHVIVNGEIGMKWQCTQPNILELTLRTVGLLVDEAVIGNLWRIWGTTMKNAGALCVQCFRVVTMPHGVLPPNVSSLELNRGHMRKILRRGYQMGVTGSGWVHDPAEFGKRVPESAVR